ncbi:MAG: hypothetical protein ACPGGN_06590 [Opitutales bacterium]
MRQVTAIIFFCSIIFSPALHGQPSEISRIEFSVYGLRPGNYSDIYFEDLNGEPVRLEFNKKSRSKTYEAKVFTESPRLRFLKRVKSNDPNQTGDAYTEISTVSLRPEKTLFVFIPNKQVRSDAAFKVLPVEDGKSRTDGGTVRILNLTGVTLVGAIDGRRFRLDALGCSPAFKIDADEPSDFSIIAEGSSRFHLVYRNNLRVDSESRAILFLTPPYRKVSLKLGGEMLYEDLLDQPEPKQMGFGNSRS